jgi:HSP20 family protein
MTLMRMDPFQRMMKRFFEEFPGELTEGIAARGWAPPVDIKETENEFVISAELPGMKMEDIEIELAGESLCIRGKREFQEKEERENYVRMERSYGSFSRTFTLGVPYDAEHVKAVYKDGVLTVTVPKSPDVRPRKIQVSQE